MKEVNINIAQKKGVHIPRQLISSLFIVAIILGLAYFDFRLLYAFPIGVGVYLIIEFIAMVRDIGNYNFDIIDGEFGLENIICDLERD